ncbi:MAG: hypothetical protein AAF517_07505, partial [Planctomycetota bacterium]
TKLRDKSEALQEIKNILQLPKSPQIMECYDISHFQGAQPVAQDDHEWAVRGRVGTARSRFSTRCSVEPPSPPPSGFQRGDANADGRTDISDAVYTLAYLFLGADEPSCLKAADSNDDGGVNISDPSFTLGHLFLGGRIFPPPIACGDDPTDDALDCEMYSACGQ